MPQDFLLEERLPYFWCASCGNGVVLHAILNSTDRLGWICQDTIIATGIGCWGKADDYTKTNTFHGTHGRALASSTGIKLANPKLHVLTLMGNGDGITIGGNHLIHATRRNVDVATITVNNLNYGMTGGQHLGTTPKNAITKTSPYGHVGQSFDVCDAVKAVGGSFVARGTVVDTVQLERLIEQAMSHKGLSFMEVISPRPMHYGRSNKSGKAPAMMERIKENIVSDTRASSMSREELKGEFVTGIMGNREQENYNTTYQHVIDELKGGEAWWENRVR